MGNIKIRKYNVSDYNRVVEIFKITSTTPFISHRALLYGFCMYYIEKEPQNCFVATDGETVVGYILCAENSKHWAEVFQNEYIDEARSLLLRQFYKSIMVYPLKHYDKYPAHLHINVAPDYQRHGIGKMLMDTLISSLKEKGINGLMLSVDRNNTKGKNFYNKYGFKVLDKTIFEIVMGIDI